MRDKDDTQDIIAQLHAIRTTTLLDVKDIYNTTEASLFLGVKRSYLYELVRNRKIKHYKSCGGIQYRPGEIKQKNVVFINKL